MPVASVPYKVTAKALQLRDRWFSFLAMTDGIDPTPQVLREEAERNFRLAVATFDAAVHDALMACCQELLDRARRMEASATGAGPSVK